jgi:AhpD family alkylhydroperoxidase
VIAGRVASSVVGRQVKHVTPVSASEAAGLVSDVYAQVADEMRIVVPPALLHSPAPEVLAAYWMLMREPLIPHGPVGRLVKEAVAATVSVANICPYCVEMHSVGLYSLSTEEDAEAIATDRVDNVSDPRVRAAANWARVAHQPDQPGAGQPPFSASDRPELVGVAVSFHYLTRMVNVFLSNFLLPPGLRPAARRRLKRGISWVLGPTLREAYEPGRSVPLLPDAELPAAAAWAAGNEFVAAATARAYTAFDTAGERSLSPAVRDLVCRRLECWRGEETGLSRDWCEQLIEELPEADRAAGRLALLTAFASYQVDEHVVREFRISLGGESRIVDTRLVEAAAWASFAAARKIGSWHVPADAGGPR